MIDSGNDGVGDVTTRDSDTASQEAIGPDTAHVPPSRPVLTRARNAAVGVAGAVHHRLFTVAAVPLYL